MPPAGTSGRAGSIEARTTPTAMTMSITPAVDADRVAERDRDHGAATAPSVATIGATIETLPMRQRRVREVEARPT